MTYSCAGALEKPQDLGSTMPAASSQQQPPPLHADLQTGFSLPLLEGPPLIDPLDVTHGVLRCWRAGVWGGLGAGAPARFRRQAYQCPSHSGVLPARLVPCMCGFCLPPREGGFHDRWSHCYDSCHGETASLALFVCQKC